MRADAWPRSRGPRASSRVRLATCRPPSLDGESSDYTAGGPARTARATVALRWPEGRTEPHEAERMRTTGHYAPWFLAAVAAGLIVLTVVPPLSDAVPWPVLLAVLGLAGYLAVAVFAHNRRLCERC